MAKKRVVAELKMQVVGGQATPAPPIGPTLSPHGVNIMQFVQQFNERTKDMKGIRVPVVITIYHDKSFSFVVKTPPASILIKMALGLEKGSSVPNREKVGKLTRAQLREIAEKKMVDLNAHDIEAAMRIIEGTARSMGVDIED
ncbi:MAG: 50S ribosomal protein L11 [Planctomycetota bacterium]|nr:MAG: 50S ribosomal protein L11 [Planctomycetota bacterium]